MKKRKSILFVVVLIIALTNICLLPTATIAAKEPKCCVFAYGFYCECDGMRFIHYRALY